jgi:deoxyribonuclease V
MIEIQSKWLFPQSIEQAKHIQKTLADQIILKDSFDTSSFLIGGMDVSNYLYDPLQMVYAVTVLLNKVTMQIEEQQGSAQKQEFPYIPGFLGFREAPALFDSYKKLTKSPGIWFVDGHGISHPRKLGIATHIGVLLDIPTIGVAKKILVGEPEGILGENKGDYVPLIWKNERIGFCVRTKKRCLPLIVSAGHRITLETSLEMVMEYVQHYRLPEPTRHAHLFANEFRKMNRQV